MLVVVDYGLGNLRSVQKAFERIKIDSAVSGEPKKILNASKLVLPGVGHFAAGMKNLKEKGIKEALNEAVLGKKIPILGICLGMQLMTLYSEEGDCAGLGWIKGKTSLIKINNNKCRTPLKVPHIGWNGINIERENSLINGQISKERFYFVHSFAVMCEDKEDEIASTEYGISFSSAFSKGNIAGVQFHPEKSYGQGIQLLRNFVENY